MEISIFLAKLFGFYLVIISLLYFFRQSFLRVVMKDFYKFPALVAVTSLINLFIGLLVILNHNIWEFSWRLIITLFGYLSLLKGLVNMFKPEWGEVVAAKCARSQYVFIYSGIISLALGLYLLFNAYYYGSF